MMMSTWFNNFKWDALAARTLALGAALETVYKSGWVPPAYQPALALLLALVLLVEAFIRNPKTLPWKEIESVVEAGKEISASKASGASPAAAHPDPNAAKPDPNAAKRAHLEAALASIQADLAALNGGA